MIFPGLGRAEDLDALVSTILATLNEPFNLDGKAVHGGASIGVTLYPRDGKSGEILLRCADQAMYRAKEEGRGRYCYFTDEMQREALRRVRMHQDLMHGWREQQFVLHYQPIVATDEQRYLKLEALLRWQHPQRRVVAPSEFIGLAEDLGMIGKLGNWALEAVLNQIRAWQADARMFPRISINKSPHQFISHEKRDDWLAIIRDHGLCPSNITVEITESVLMDGRKHIARQLSRYRDAGMQIALDDFGTGYSSLAYLRRFPIDFVKIDRSFVTDIAKSEGDRNLVEAIVAMCNKLKVGVIAEGVETEAQRDTLAQIGCYNMQGYLFGNPQPADEVAQAFAA